jgi:two-component system response regulator MprA
MLAATGQRLRSYARLTESGYGRGEVRILIADDELAVRSSISRALELKGYLTGTAADGREALERLGAGGFDAIVLDLMMPDVDGLEVCRRMRAAGDATPVLMLTARDAIGDRVAGLDAGADDYLVKPFALEELLARLRALLRRAPVDGDRPPVLTFADLRMDTGAYQVWRGERLIDLTRTEFVLLELLLRHPRQVLTRSTIFERVWGYDFGSGSNSLGVYVGYLRRKLEEGGEPRLLHTVRGVGYVLRES